MIEKGASMATLQMQNAIVITKAKVWNALVILKYKTQAKKDVIKTPISPDFRNGTIRFPKTVFESMLIM